MAKTRFKLLGAVPERQQADPRSRGPKRLKPVRKEQAPSAPPPPVVRKPTLVWVNPREMLASYIDSQAR
jgi:hypothetical protein